MGVVEGGGEGLRVERVVWRRRWRVRGLLFPRFGDSEPALCQAGFFFAFSFNACSFGLGFVRAEEVGGEGDVKRALDLQFLVLINSHLLHFSLMGGIGE